MAGTTQATVAVAAPEYAKRRARALIGWLAESEGVLWLAGRMLQAVPDPAHLTRCQQARNLVAARQAALDQTNFAVPLPPELQPHIAAVRAQPLGARMIADSGEPMLVDLRRICAVQPVIHIEDAMTRVKGLTATDLLGIAALTLPVPAPTPDLPCAFDDVRQTHIISSANPNLRVAGQFSGLQLEIGPGLKLPAFGFVVSAFQSYLSVAGVGGRYFLRDGYHRAYGLLRAGITHAPALVRNYGSVEETGLPAGMLPFGSFMGERPPTLGDYLDDDVCADTFAPITTKMIVIQALQLTPLG
jgi:hypothetical protein